MRPALVECLPILGDGVGEALHRLSLLGGPSIPFARESRASARRHGGDTALPGIDWLESVFYRAKLDTARFFLHRLLPQIEALARAIEAGGAEPAACGRSSLLVALHRDC